MWLRENVGNSRLFCTKNIGVQEMSDLDRCQKLLVGYKYKLCISVMALMALDALLIKGFIDMFSAILNGSLLVLTVVALFTLGYYRKKYHYYKVMVYGEEEFTQLVTVIHY